MTLLTIAITSGLIIGLFALGVNISLTRLRFPDLTSEGAFLFAAALSAVMVRDGFSPWLIVTAAMLCGALAGLATGGLWLSLKVNPALSGIVTMTALYALSIMAMGQNSIQLLRFRTIPSVVAESAAHFYPGDIAGDGIESHSLSFMLFMLIMVTLISLLLLFLSRTRIGAVIRALSERGSVGALRSIGINTGFAAVCALAVANAVCALAGTIMAQYQGVAEIHISAGMYIFAVAAISVGELFSRREAYGSVIFGIICGAVILCLAQSAGARAGIPFLDTRLFPVVLVVIFFAVKTFFRKPQTGDSCGKGG